MTDYITQFPKIFIIKNLAAFLFYVYKFLPKAKVLGNLLNRDTHINFFVADLLVADNVSSSPKLYSTYNGQIHVNPNIGDVWPECEGKGLVKFFLELGQFNKTDNISVKKMSKDANDWDGNVVLFGAQTGKCQEFYRVMKNVGYRVERDGIYRQSDGEKIISLPNGSGYGLIIKTRNSLAKEKESLAFLLGGYGVLGTQAAIEYFFNNLNELGKEFGEKGFSIIIKKELTDPEGKFERLGNFDLSYY